MIPKVALDLTIKSDEKTIECSFESSNIKETVAKTKKYIENSHNEGSIHIDDQPEPPQQILNKQPEKVSRSRYLIIKKNKKAQQVNKISAQLQECMGAMDQQGEDIINKASNNLAQIQVEQAFEIDIAQSFSDSFYRAVLSELRHLQEQSTFDG